MMPLLLLVQYSDFQCDVCRGSGKGSRYRYVAVGFGAVLAVLSHLA